MVNDIMISFIIPVYNIKDYLEEAFISIINQQIEDLEILLVDDGSTDGSDLICKKISDRYKCVKYYRKQNAGVSAARNYGLSVARGKYICFLDGDDFYIGDHLNEFIKICNIYEIDVFRGLYQIFDNEKKIFLPFSDNTPSYNDKILSGEEFLQKSIQENTNEVVPWLGFFRREYLLKNQIVFPEGIGYEEDHIFFLKALLGEGCKVWQSNKIFYAYRKRGGSATKTPTVKQALDVVSIVELEHDLIDSLVLCKETRKAALRFSSGSLYQLTSIYGRVNKEDKSRIAKVVPFKMKWKCVCYASNRHQQMKIFLFTFMRWFVDLVYLCKR